MGEWMEAYIEGKNVEPDMLGDGEPQEWKCKGVLDREGKCKNVMRSPVFRMYCDECRQYFKEREWGK